MHIYIHTHTPTHNSEQPKRRKAVVLGDLGPRVWRLRFRVQGTQHLLVHFAPSLDSELGRHAWGQVAWLPLHVHQLAWASLHLVGTGKACQGSEVLGSGSRFRV